MKYKVTHTTQYRYTDPVPISHNLLHLAPRETRRQFCIHHRLLIHPTPAHHGQRIDSYGNTIDFFSIQHAHQGLSVTSTSHIEVRPLSLSPNSGSPPWESVVAELKQDRSASGIGRYEFVFDSPLIRASAVLADYARQSFTPGCPILTGIRDLTQRIYTDFRYDSKATTVTTPVETAFRNRSGVCQDFAQIEIGCLRSIGLAARYVSGYLRTEPPPGQARLVGADASHAWLSVYAGPLHWIDVDPTNNRLVSSDHITVAWGRDYADVCPVQGTFLGGGHHTMTTSVDVVPLGRETRDLAGSQ